MAAGAVLVSTTLICTPLLAAPITIMPMGDSITVGVDYTGNSSGGYRDPLYADLTQAGLSVQFEGATNTSPTANLTSTGNQYHNGYGSWHIQDLTNNLNGDVQPSYGDANQGGYFLTGTGTRPAQAPKLLLLEIGTNDFLQQQQSGIDDRIDTLVTSIHALSPSTLVLIAGCIPINGDAGFNAEISAYDGYIQNTLVPSLSYAKYVDLYDDFISNGTTNSSLYGADNIHPVEAGYQAMATTWAGAIEQAEVPEPSSLALLGVAAIAGTTRRRRRNC
jgi:lysophospholipase L1-like esterase